MYPKNDPFSDLRSLSIRSFIAHGHEYHLYTYGEPDIGKMNGLVVRDAGEIIPREEAERLSRAKDGDFHGLFWWTYLQKKGGWLADKECICLRPFDFDDELILSFLAHRFEGHHLIKLPKAHPLTGTMIDAISRPEKRAPWRKAPPKPSVKQRLRALLLPPRKPPPVTPKDRKNRALPHAVRFHKLKHPRMADFPCTFHPIVRASASYLTSDVLHDTEILQAIMDNAHSIFLWETAWNARASEHSPVATVKRLYPPQ